MKAGDKLICIKRVIDPDYQVPQVGEICTVEQCWRYNGEWQFNLEHFAGSWTMEYFQLHIPEEKMEENLSLWDDIAE